MRLMAVACEIMYREISYCVSQSPNIVDVRFLRKGLHDVGEAEMSKTLQDEIDRIPKDKYEAILLGYGLCSNGIRGLRSEHIPLVVPKAHDCITLLLGSKERYREHFDKYPGTYFRSTGWLERNTPVDGTSGVSSTQLGLGRSYEQLVAKYGEDNARYIAETLKGWARNYSRLGYIDMGIGDFPRHEEMAKQEALDKGWTFERIQGDVGLLKRMVDGDWRPSEVLVVQPGMKVVPIYVDDIIRTDKA